MTEAWNAFDWAIDLSHHNTVLDWDRVAAQRPACVLLKATERRWTDPVFEKNRGACIDRGLLWLPYVFLRPDDDAGTIRHFLDVAGDAVASGVPAALDWEEPQGPGTNPVSSAVVEAWIDALPRRPLCYYGLYPPAPATAKIAGCPRWFPQYPGSMTAPPRLPAWDGGAAEPDWRTAWLLWQWSPKGAIDGIAGPVDLNRLAISAERFARWYVGGRFDAPGQPDPLSDGSAAGDPVELVKAAQRILVAGGFLKPSRPGADPVDGDPGPLTREALRAWLSGRHP